MKRSEMVLLIKDILYSEYIELKQNGRHYRAADKLLSKLEWSGMMFTTTDGHGNYTISEWDKENG